MLQNSWQELVGKGQGYHVDRWAELGEFSGYEEGKYWAWAMFGAAVMGLPAELPTGRKLTRLMDDLQGGFQTLPVKLPASPYSRALDARQTIVDMIHEQIESLQMQVQGRHLSPNQCCGLELHAL